MKKISLVRSKERLAAGHSELTKPLNFGGELTRVKYMVMEDGGVVVPLRKKNQISSTDFNINEEDIINIDSSQFLFAHPVRGSVKNDLEIEISPKGSIIAKSVVPDYILNIGNLSLEEKFKVIDRIQNNKPKH